MQTFYLLNKKSISISINAFQHPFFIQVYWTIFQPLYFLPLQDFFWHFAIIVHINIVNSQKVYKEIVSPRTYHVFAPTGFHVV